MPRHRKYIETVLKIIKTLFYMVIQYRHYIYVQSFQVLYYIKQIIYHYETKIITTERLNYLLLLVKK